jgi:hypothetical protein
MLRVILSSPNVIQFSEGGGHWWVFAQWILGLKKCGCDVWWMEEISSVDDRTGARIALFKRRLSLLGMEGKALVISRYKSSYDYLTHSAHEAEQLIKSADLLLNFNYHLSSETIGRFKRTALVDIDPGLLQFWISAGQIFLQEHHVYFTTGETVGAAEANFPSCGITWHRVRPVVDTEVWAVRYNEAYQKFTTISSWWGGGGKGEWITNGSDILFENNKRVTFLRFTDLPDKVPRTLELALSIDEGVYRSDARGRSDLVRSGSPEDVTDYVDDATDVQLLRAKNWSVVVASQVSGSPDAYMQYIGNSRGEFSCAKPSCLYFQNAWVSDRTLCYLASGKPVVLQDTGPSAFLPRDRGMFRFSSLDDAVAAFEAIESNYQAQCASAREVAEAYFEASTACELVLAEAFS